MGYCSHCGEKLPKDAMFCPKCGTKAATVASAALQPSDEIREALAKASQEMEKAFNVAAKELQTAFQKAKENVQSTLYREPVICSNCGEKNASDAYYCSKCGNKLHTEPVQKPTENT